MINTLTLQEAVQKCPAIVATAPSTKASSRYNFIPTSNIIDQALKNDWVIRDARGGKGEHGQHCVSLVHRSQLNVSAEEGFPQLLVTNSHNLSRKFSLSLGFFRLICSNGLIAPLGMFNSIQPTLHRQNNNLGSITDIVSSLENALGQYGNVLNNIENMKARELSEEEKNSLARFAYYARFRYRMSQPKKVDSASILLPRRAVDQKNDLWSVFNVIQENMTHGGNRIGNGITRFQDDIRFNQELWTGVDKAISFKGEELTTVLKSLFPKKERTKKIVQANDN